VSAIVSGALPRFSSTSATSAHRPGLTRTGDASGTRPMARRGKTSTARGTTRDPGPAWIWISAIVAGPAGNVAGTMKVTGMRRPLESRVAVPSSGTKRMTPGDGVILYRTASPGSDPGSSTAAAAVATVPGSTRATRWPNASGATPMTSATARPQLQVLNAENDRNTVRPRYVRRPIQTDPKLEHDRLPPPARQHRRRCRQHGEPRRAIQTPLEVRRRLAAEIERGARGLDVEAPVPVGGLDVDLDSLAEQYEALVEVRRQGSGKVDGCRRDASDPDLLRGSDGGDENGEPHGHHGHTATQEPVSAPPHRSNR